MRQLSASNHCLQAQQALLRMKRQSGRCERQEVWLGAGILQLSQFVAVAQYEHVVIAQVLT